MPIGAKLGGLVAVFAVALVAEAGAYPLELAKKCRALTEETYPLRVPGNPAAGSDKGTGAEMRFYYKNCIDNGGEAIDLRP
jgi:hypothetical protein